MFLNTFLCSSIARILLSRRQQDVEAKLSLPCCAKCGAPTQLGEKTDCRHKKSVEGTPKLVVGNACTPSPCRLQPCFCVGLKDCLIVIDLPWKSKNKFYPPIQSIPTCNEILFSFRVLFSWKLYKKKNYQKSHPGHHQHLSSRLIQKSTTCAEKKCKYSEQNLAGTYLTKAILVINYTEERNTATYHKLVD